MEAGLRGERCGGGGSRVKRLQGDGIEGVVLKQSRPARDAWIETVCSR